MGQPTPPGDNVPLFDGLDSAWNDIVGALPEDKRAELAPRLRDRIGEYEKRLQPWAEFEKSGVDPGQIGTALNIYSVIENNPREVYETLGKHLGLTPAETKQAVETMQESVDEDDPRIATLQQQVDTLAAIALAQRQQTEAEKTAAEQDKALNKELDDLRKKYNDVDEEEVIMRMLHKGLSAEQAYAEYSGKVTQLRTTRPSPMLIGGAGGQIPKPAIDPTKLDNSSTKDLVAQMMQAAVTEGKR